ncbi:hypothetical protein UFOVP1339_43 [uncultured Caudovirales phage]|uniref:Acb2/Tad1 hairpin domain-containing protein n=1 Tax=uncultured Caudovirales phage TaxID=2100421 RepID=A0A6J5RT98_9CAUD|nr:hypothetical protein UFOVP1339_43 [uncultured Caudovirales phage]
MPASPPKPHKGTINSWLKWELPASQGNQGLGYVIIGDSVDHPEFGGGPIHTSWVVSHEGSEIETRNSRYTLGRSAIEPDPVLITAHSAAPRPFPSNEELHASWATLKEISEAHGLKLKVSEPPRHLSDHIVPGLDHDPLQIEVIDQPGSGGANHLYRIGGYDNGTNPSTSTWINLTDILFQNGPIPEKGTNGLTHEALLTIVMDRLRSFQRGPFASRENALALTHIEMGLMWLQQRTLRRLARGVEGTHHV